jgi:hypothetical protein
MHFSRLAHLSAVTLCRGNTKVMLSFMLQAKEASLSSTCHLLVPSLGRGSWCNLGAASCDAEVCPTLVAISTMTQCLMRPARFSVLCACQEVMASVYICLQALCKITNLRVPTHQQEIGWGCCAGEDWLDSDASELRQKDLSDALTRSSAVPGEPGSLVSRAYSMAGTALRRKSARVCS